MKVKDIMYPAHRIDCSSTVFEAAKFMAEHSLGSVFIEDSGKVKGIVTERDMVVKILAKGINASASCVKDIMSAPVISVGPETSLEEASEVMANNKIRRLAVVEYGKIIGKVTTNLISKNMKYYLAVKLFKNAEMPGIIE